MAESDRDLLRPARPGETPGNVEPDDARPQPLDLDAEAVLAALRSAGWKVDVVHPDGHTYWSTHCRHGRHEACAATELAPGVPRRPSQCKTCKAPCVCPECHDGRQQNEARA